MPSTQEARSMPKITMTRKKWILTSGLASLLVLIGLFALLVWILLFQSHDAKPRPISEYFKYGSIGTEPDNGLPYWIWLVLPEIFPEHLPGPGGYASLGFVWEEGEPTPIGITKEKIGIFPRAGLNCSVCHTSVYRTSAAAEQRIVLGGASQGFNILAYQRFLFDVAGEPDFTADIILEEIEKAGGSLNWFSRQLYRYLIIPQTKSALLDLKEDWEWSYRNPEWGPGRFDPFNPVKFDLLDQPIDGTIGTSDMLPIWDMKSREGMVFHWDGLNSDLREVVLSSAIGDGATPKSLDLEVMARIQTFIEELPSPEYPFEIDAGLAEAGRTVFAQSCAVCHTRGEGRTGQVIPVEEVGTDRHRVDMWGAKDAAAYNEKYEDKDWGFEHFVDIDGYAAMPLSGLWLSAPYLHNGSVPNLRDLLNPPSERPKKFYRGYDVFDPDNVGFISDLAQDSQTSKRFFEFDTSLPGNSNEGHLFGTELTAQEKEALIEYLKTK